MALAAAPRRLAEHDVANPQHAARKGPPQDVRRIALARRRPRERWGRIAAVADPAPPTSLPSPVELERTCKGLAALDAMACAEWQDRYYSFNHAWNETGTERMASMRNGSGDEWFVLFTPAGAFVKAFWHEYPPENVDAVYAGMPATLAPHLKEPAFSVHDVTFGGWHDGTAWTLRGNATPMAEQLAILSGDPESYRAYAADYFEVQLPLDAIAHVLAGKPLDTALVARLSTERTLAELEDDLAEIAY
jgi:hypothetical protein